MFSSSEVIFSRLPERFCFWGNQDEFWELSLKLQKTGIRTSMWASWLDIISPKKQNKKQPSSWAVVSCYFIFHPWVFVSLCLASLRCRICFVSGFSVVTASHVLLIFVSLQSFKHLVCTDGHVILVYRPLISDSLFNTTETESPALNWKCVSVRAAWGFAVRFGGLFLTCWNYSWWVFWISEAQNSFLANSSLFFWKLKSTSFTDQQIQMFLDSLFSEARK